MNTTTVAHYAVNPPKRPRDGWRQMLVGCGATGEALLSTDSRDAVTCPACIDVYESGRAAWEAGRSHILRVVGPWRRLRRFLSVGIRCVACDRRIDGGVPFLAVASPSRLQADHWPECPARRSIMEAYAS